MSGPCQCNLCVTERAWEEEHDFCYRCSHGLPCQLQQENGVSCCDLLDDIPSSDEDEPECGEDCPGWAIFNGHTIERCMTCGRISDNDTALRLARGAGLSVGDDGYLFGTAYECGHFGKGMTFADLPKPE